MTAEVGHRHGRAAVANITDGTVSILLGRGEEKSGGRDNHGHISMRRIGGGHKRKYRIIDFKRDKDGIDRRYVRAREEIREGRPEQAEAAE